MRLNYRLWSWLLALGALMMLMTAVVLPAQEYPDTDEPEAPEWTGAVTIARVKVVIDGYTWIKDSPDGAFHPSPRNEEGLKVSATRPETILWLIGIEVGQSFAQAELEDLAARREKELSNANIFFNNAVSVLPVPSDPTKRTLAVDVKPGFTLRPSAGGAFAYLADWSCDGNLLKIGAALGFNVDSFTIGHGVKEAGPLWWDATVGYQNNLLGAPVMEEHTFSLAGRLGSAWLPLSPWLTARVHARVSPQGTPLAAWAVSTSANGQFFDRFQSPDKLLGFSYSGWLQCPVTFYAPDWQPIVQPEIRLAAKPSLGPVELGLQASMALSSQTALDEFSLNLMTGDRGIRGGFGNTRDVYVDRLLMGNIELRLKAINFPFWIFESVGIWPFAYLDLAATGHLGEADWFGHQHLAAGGGLRLYLGIPVMLGFTFAYGWSAEGIGSFTFAVSQGF